MAKYPIVVVKENPGTQDVAGKFTILVKWRDDETGKRHHAEFKLPDVVGKVSSEGVINGKPVQALNGLYQLEVGPVDYAGEDDLSTQL